jgi:hypothetical protein
MKTYKALIYLFPLLLSSIAFGQKEVLELDLASISPGETKLVSEDKNVTYKALKLINTVPAKEYSVRFELERRMLDPINPSSLSSTDMILDPDINDLCTDLLTYISDLNTNELLTEIEIKNRISTELKVEINNCKENISEKKAKLQAGNDPDKVEKLEQLDVYNDSINNQISATNIMFQKHISIDIQVGTGEIGRIYVSNGDSEWTFVLKGKQQGQWVTTYGFGFTSQRLESPTYFAKQIPDTAAFQIIKSNQADVWDLNYVPAIFFSYFPSQNFNSCWNHSLTAGLGFGLNLSAAPIVFFGYNGMFYNNIGFSTGVAFHQQHRIKSQYSENDIITTTLDKDQLHDKIFRPNFFVSINFRFGENPFKPKNSGDKEEDKK